MVVCAAGNAGRQNANAPAGLNNEGYGAAYGTIQVPGNDPYVITVGAMKSTSASRADDRIATYSSRGPSRLDYVLKPDLVAPGNRVVSLEAKQAYLENTYWSSTPCPSPPTPAPAVTRIPSSTSLSPAPPWPRR